MGPQVCKACKHNKAPEAFALLRPGKLDHVCRGCKAIQKAAKQIAAKQPNTNQGALIQ
jgi:iron-sulfur cluster repair protein YtfE (RIC family)